MKLIKFITKSEGPPDLDQLIKDFFDRVLGKSDKAKHERLRQQLENPQQPGGEPPHQDPQKPSQSPQPLKPMPTLNKSWFLLAVVLLLGAWLATGFYTVQQGELGVVTQFGRYIKTSQPGLQWHLPYPIQRVQVVDIAAVRTFTVGYRNTLNNKVLSEAIMLTEDENIVDVQFNVQYRLKPDLKTPTGYSAAANYLFYTADPDNTVREVAESAMREVVGQETLDKILYESRQKVAMMVKQIMQNRLDAYHTGVEVNSVAIQNVQPPEQVQAAFNDVIKAGQDRQRTINNANAYANKVIPLAKGQAQRILQDAEAYAASEVYIAQGNAARFLDVERAYKMAPTITKERMYIQVMQQVFSKTRKIILDANLKNPPVIYLGAPASAAKGPVKAATDTSATSSLAPVDSASVNPNAVPYPVVGGSATYNNGGQP